MNDLQINAGDILQSALKALGNDGLYSGTGCNCHRDDLIPCASDPSFCLPGYLQPDGTIGPNRYVTLADRERAGQVTLFHEEESE